MKKQPKFRKRIKEIETKDMYSGERSPYWDWIGSHQRPDEEGQVREDPFANPDVLSEDDHMYHKPLSPENELKFQVIRQAMAVLSPQQRQVLQLCGVEGMTLKEAASTLGIGLTSVQEHLEQAKAKIIRIYQREKLKEDNE